jgi:hypothetical protein
MGEFMFRAFDKDGNALLVGGPGTVPSDQTLSWSVLGSALAMPFGYDQVGDRRRIAYFRVFDMAGVHPVITRVHFTDYGRRAKVPSFQALEFPEFFSGSALCLGGTPIELTGAEPLVKYHVIVDNCEGQRYVDLVRDCDGDRVTSITYWSKQTMREEGSTVGGWMIEGHHSIGFKKIPCCGSRDEAIRHLWGTVGLAE